MAVTGHEPVSAENLRLALERLKSVIDDEREEIYSTFGTFQVEIDTSVDLKTVASSGGVTASKSGLTVYVSVEQAGTYRLTATSLGAKSITVNGASLANGESLSTLVKLDAGGQVYVTAKSGSYVAKANVSIERVA